MKNKLCCLLSVLYYRYQKSEISDFVAYKLLNLKNFIYMKKLFSLVIMLCVMSFAGNNLFAQNENQSFESEPLISDTTLSDEVSSVSEPESTPAESPFLTMNDLQNVVALLNNTTGGKKQNILNGDDKVFVPISHKGKFNGHHICQRLELSVLSGQDKMSDDPELDAIINAKSGGKEGSADDQKSFTDELSEKGLGFNFGANFGYSVVFVPGCQEGDKLLLNRFGFAYSVGAIFQVDHEKKAGVTCDFLGKIGVETGFNKAIGVGVDFLFGGGKTAQTVLDLTDFDFEKPDIDDLVITQENNWCAKAGTQLWLRLNFLTKSVNNFDTALFTRFVYSFRPYSNEDRLERMETYSEIAFWQSESWSFGFTMTYFF